jgi:hypothetical protein
MAKKRIEQECMNVHTKFYQAQELSQEDLELKEKVILTHPNKFNENMNKLLGEPHYCFCIFCVWPRMQFNNIC